MLTPVRCFTCGNLIADKDADYQARIRAGEDPARALDALGVTRYCCRRMMFTTVKTIDQIIPFYEAIHARKKEVQSELE